MGRLAATFWVRGSCFRAPALHLLALLHEVLRRWILGSSHRASGDGIMLIGGKVKVLERAKED
jgi:hypothetical protein